MARKRKNLLYTDECQPLTQEQMANIKSQFHPSNTANVNIVPYKIYSPNEQIIGKWIDGGDLYGKVITETRNTVDVQYIQMPSNISICMSYGWLKLADGTVVYQGYYNSATDRFMPYYDGSNNRMIVQATDIVGTLFFIILYTKTTI